MYKYHKITITEREHFNGSNRSRLYVMSTQVASGSNRAIITMQYWVASYCSSFVHTYVNLCYLHLRQYRDPHSTVTAYSQVGGG